MIIRFKELVVVGVLFATILCRSGFAQVTERISVDSMANQADGYSWISSISAGGRYIAFMSNAANLVPGDTNISYDIFVRDRQSGETERISVDSNGGQANDASDFPAISADGRFVVFWSKASQLVPGDTNASEDIFVHDRSTLTTRRVSLDSLSNQADSSSYSPSISADGRWVAFMSLASNLVPADTNGVPDIFVHDLQTGNTERVNVDDFGTQANGYSLDPSISADGRYVAFRSSASNLIVGDSNASHDIFVRDRFTGTTKRVSVDPTGSEANGGSFDPSISANGRHIAFKSSATNLVPADTNTVPDIFTHDQQTGVTQRMSVDAFGIEGNGESYDPAISANGRHVAFRSSASNLVPGDTNGVYDVFAHDRQTSAIERISVNSTGTEGNGEGWYPSISADGRHISFKCYSDNLVPGDSNQLSDVFVRDRWGGQDLNTIILTGPFLAPVSTPLVLSWSAAPPSSSYWLAYSLNLNGSAIGGHIFELGAPYSIIHTGANSNLGTGNYTTSPIPSQATGLTVYFEIGARDSVGILNDSITHSVTFH